MRRTCLAIILLSLTTPVFPAAEPIGEWLVKDGTARIRIDACANGLWGYISWTKSFGTDGNNPDPAKRTRPIVGVPVVRGMMPAAKPGKWEGEIYNAENGKMYKANITLVSDDVLRVEGCVLGGLLCGGENWTRVLPAEETAPVPPRAEHMPPPAKSAPKAKAKPATSPAAPPANQAANQMPPQPRTCADE